jgi:hypothetical protein
MTPSGTQVFADVSVNPLYVYYNVINNLYSSPYMSIIRVIKSWKMERVKHIQKIGNVYEIFVRKCKWRRPLRRLGHRQKDNIKIDLKKTV